LGKKKIGPVRGGGNCHRGQTIIRGRDTRGGMGAIWRRKQLKTGDLYHILTQREGDENKFIPVKRAVLIRGLSGGKKKK